MAYNQGNRVPSFPDFPQFPQFSQQAPPPQLASQIQGMDGGTQFNTRGPEYPVNQAPDLSKYFTAIQEQKEMLARISPQYQAQSQPQQPSRLQERMNAPAAPSNTNMGMQEDQLRRAQISAQIADAQQREAQSQAFLGPTPVKMQGQGIQQSPGWGIADPYMMSAAQRQLFLPKESTEPFGPDSYALAEKTRQELKDKESARWEEGNRLRNTGYTPADRPGGAG